MYRNLYIEMEMCNESINDDTSRLTG